MLVADFAAARPMLVVTPSLTKVKQPSAPLFCKETWKMGTAWRKPQIPTIKHRRFCC